MYCKLCNSLYEAFCIMCMYVLLYYTAWMPSNTDSNMNPCITYKLMLIKTCMTGLVMNYLLLSIEKSYCSKIGKEPSGSKNRYGAIGGMLPLA